MISRIKCGFLISSLRDKRQIVMEVLLNGMDLSKKSRKISLRPKERDQQVDPEQWIKIYWIKSEDWLVTLKWKKLSELIAMFLNIYSFIIKN